MPIHKLKKDAVLRNRNNGELIRYVGPIEGNAKAVAFLAPDGQVRILTPADLSRHTYFELETA